MFRYFKRSDFQKATPSCNISDMEYNFLFMLDMARHLAGIPFVLTSAYRSVEHELSKGRDGTSSHTKGIAVDIRTRNSTERFIILEALRRVGFKRLGVANSFIHVDLDLEKEQQVMWLYP